MQQKQLYCNYLLFHCAIITAHPRTFSTMSALSHLSPRFLSLLVRFDCCCVYVRVCVQDHSTLLVVCFCLSCPRVTPDPKLVSPHKFSFFARCQSIKRIFYSSVCLFFGAQRLTTASHPYLLLSPLGQLSVLASWADKKVRGTKPSCKLTKN